MSNDLELQKTDPSSLLALAVDKGADIDKLKELMDLQDRWEKKQAKKSFLEALSKFQTLVPVLKKNRTAKVTTKAGGHYTYRYSDLGGITQQIKKALNDCGLSYRWEFQEANAIMKVTCHVSHLDGHTETASMEAGKDATGNKNDIQQKGSTQTYLQRYTLIGALGLSTAEEDDDSKGSPATQEVSHDEALEQWKDLVSQTKTKIELTALYLKNKKVVEAHKDIQAIFKKREAEFKGQSSPKVEMA